MIELDPVLHQATRLRIMVFLYQNRAASFVTLRDALDLSDGNLAGHVQRLEQASYVLSRRVLAGVHFEVRVSITEAGSAAFRTYLTSLRTLLQRLESVPGPDAVTPSPGQTGRS